MAPINHLTKRVSLEMSTQPLGKAMIGAIAGGATFIVLFLVGLGVFLYFYIKSSKRPNPAHVGPNAIHQSSSVNVIQEEKAITSETSSAAISPSITPAPTMGPTPTRTPPVQLQLVIDTPPHSAASSPEPSVPKKTHERRTLQKSDPWKRQSMVSNNSLDTGLPATPGNEFV